MMNREYMKQTYAGNITAWREYRAQIAQDTETLCGIITTARVDGRTPDEAAAEIAEKIGREAAAVIIASAVNANEHDGRISAAVKAWAQGVGWDWEMTCDLGIVGKTDSIHMCHINQTAESIMNLPTEPEQPETEPETAETEQEEETMKNYSYEECMKSDILDYITENIDRADYIENRAELEEKLNEDCWIADSVTGNTSGSYYCNAYRSREAVIADGIDYIREACADFGIEAAEIGERFVREEWEWMDVTIRCYLLGGMISAVLDGLEEAGYFEESEADESDIIAEAREQLTA